LLCAGDKDEEEERPAQNAVKSVSNTAAITTAFLRNLSGDVTIEIKTGNNGCIIGRKKDMANCVINSRAIGKIHAEIVEREGEYYIKDLNSRNGTCVNSVRVEPGTEVKLSHRDILTFANEDYILMISGKTSL
jgi:pSer/pThr/pTyr-binding forkhead associated (FHA) protein